MTQQEITNIRKFNKYIKDMKSNYERQEGWKEAMMVGWIINKFNDLNLDKI